MNSATADSSAHNDWFERGIAELRIYSAEYGHTRVPQPYTAPSGFALGVWVGNRRRDCRLGTLRADRIADLDALPGWTWTARDHSWERGLAGLRQFIRENGHSRVPRTHVTQNHLKLGAWVSSRRQEYRTGRMRPDHVAELEALPEWTWDPVSASWERGIAELILFVAEHDHACVPCNYAAPNGFRLGWWASRRRRDYHGGALSDDQVAQLESFTGWTWNAHRSRWRRGMDELQAYVEEYGHARVPCAYVSPRHFNLGSWTLTRRRDHQEGRLSSARIAELEALPGWSWSVPDTRWEHAVTELRLYVEEHGHALVPCTHMTSSGFRLGQWVSSRRQDRRHKKLSDERIAELEAFPGWSWALRKRRRPSPAPAAQDDLAAAS